MVDFRNFYSRFSEHITKLNFLLGGNNLGVPAITKIEILRRNEYGIEVKIRNRFFSSQQKKGFEIFLLYVRKNCRVP